MNDNIDLENIHIEDSNINPEMTFRKLCFLNMQQLTNFPYIEKDFDALTDYELLGLVVKYLNDVINNSNEQNESITNLYNAFLQLQNYMNESVQELEDEWNDKTTELENAFNELNDYVRDYFANLDVQDEINNKLDEMLEDGVLEQIIEQFLQSTAIWCFNTVADMKAATNLIDGSDARTLGYYSINDGGGALYHITDTESQTEYQEEVGDLYATLIFDDNVNAKQFGAYGDNSHNDTTFLQNCINYCQTNHYEMFIPYGTYLVNDLVCNGITIKGNNATLKTQSNTSNFIINTTDSVIENINFDCNNLINTAIKITGLNLKLENSTIFNSTGWAVLNTVRDADDHAIFKNVTINNCYGGLQLYGYSYENNAYKSTVELIDCKSENNAGYGEENSHIYYISQVNYVYILGGNFTGNIDRAVFNVYIVNHVIIDGGYYHDVRHGVTLGKITKNAIVTNNIIENIKHDSGISVDLVTAERVYPEGHCIITNNIIKNAHRGMYIQGKNVIINNNYFYGGEYSTVTTGYIRCNNADDNTTNSNIFIDNLFLYNFPSMTNFINTGTAIATIGKNIIIDGAVDYSSFAASNYFIRNKVRTATSSTTFDFTDDIIIADATDSSFNVFLPSSTGNYVTGKIFRIIRIDSVAGHSVILRCRSDNGSIDGTSGLQKSITTGVTNIVQVGKGNYYTF